VHHTLLSAHVSHLIFFFPDPATPAIYTLSLHDALPISRPRRKGCARSTPVSSSAIVTPRPSLSESPMSGRCPSSDVDRRLELSEAGYAARTGKTPATSGARSSSAMPRASNAAENPLSVRV